MGTKSTKCGFCLTGSHDRCVKAMGWYDRVWACDCSQCDNTDAVNRYNQEKEKDMARRSDKETHPTRTAVAKTPTELTLCLVTGRPTKGGRFAPGMDARYVSERVSDVITKAATLVQTRKRIADETGSPKLVEKFEKSLDSARERAVKDKARVAAGKTRRGAPVTQKSDAPAKAPRRRAEKVAPVAIPDDVDANGADPDDF